MPLINPNEVIWDDAGGGSIDPGKVLWDQPETEEEKFKKLNKDLEIAAIPAQAVKVDLNTRPELDPNSPLVRGTLDVGGNVDPNRWEVKPWQKSRIGPQADYDYSGKLIPPGVERPSPAKLRQTISTIARETNYDPIAGAEIIARGIPRAVMSTLSSGAAAIQGAGGVNVVNKSWMDKFIKDQEAKNEQFSRDIQMEFPGDQKVLPGLSAKDVSELPGNLGFSGVSMAAGAAAAAPFLLAPEPLATKLGAWAAAMGASGTVAYRMSSNQIMRTYLDTANEQSIDLTGNPLTTKKQEELRNKFMSEARKYGLYEAIPEAIGSGAEVGILLRPLAKTIGKGMATKILGKAFGVVGSEMLTETPTQMGQQGVEARAGLGTGEPAREWTDLGDWARSAKEVWPQVFLMSSVLGGVGAVGYHAKKSYSDNKISQIVQAGVKGDGLQQIPDRILLKVDKNIADLVDKRKYDMGLIEARMAVNAEVKRRLATKSLAPGQGFELVGQPYDPAMAVQFVQNLRPGAPIAMGNPTGTAHFDYRGQTFEVPLPNGPSPIGSRYGDQWALDQIRSGKARPIGENAPGAPRTNDLPPAVTTIPVLPPAPGQAPSAEAVLSPERGVKPEIPGRTPKETASLTQWVKSKGGIWDKSLPGEMRQLGQKEGRTVALIRKNTGRPLDELAMLAVEDGWLPPGSTSREFLDLVTGEIQGRKATRTGAVVPDDQAALNEFYGQIDPKEVIWDQPAPSTTPPPASGAPGGTPVGPGAAPPRPGVVQPPAAPGQPNPARRMGENDVYRFPNAKAASDYITARRRLKDDTLFEQVADPQTGEVIVRNQNWLRKEARVAEPQKTFGADTEALKREAEKLGVTYKGPWMDNGKVLFQSFTDKLTNGDFALMPGQDLKAAVLKSRKGFVEAGNIPASALNLAEPKKVFEPPKEFLALHADLLKSKDFRYDLFTPEEKRLSLEGLSELKKVEGLEGAGIKTLAKRINSELRRRAKLQRVDREKKVMDLIDKIHDTERAISRSGVGANTIVKRRQLGKREEKRFAPPVNSAEEAAISALPELKNRWFSKGSFDFSTEPPQFTFNKLGQAAKELFLYPIRKANGNYQKAISRVKSEVEKQKGSISRKSEERIFSYLAALDPKGRAMLKKQGTGIIDATKLTDAEKDVIRWYRAKMEYYFDAVNDAFKKSGRKPMGKRENYVTFGRDLEAMEAEGIPVDQPQTLSAQIDKAIRDGNFHPTQAPFGYAISRTGAMYPLDVKFFQTATRYMLAAERSINMTPPIAKGRELIGSYKDMDLETGDVKPWTLQDEKPETFKFLQNYLDTAAGVERTIFGKDLERKVRWLRRNLQGATLSGNTRTSIVQATALIPAATELGPVYFTKGVNEWIRLNGKGARMESDVLIPRGGGDVNVKEMMTRQGMKIPKKPGLKRIGMKTLSGAGKTKQIATSFGFLPIKIIDGQVADITYLGAKAKGLKMGMDETRAQQYADEIVIQTQSSGDRIELSPLQLTELGRVFSMFQNFVINRYHNVKQQMFGIGMEGKGINWLKVLSYWLGMEAVSLFFEEFLNTQSPEPSIIVSGYEAHKEGKNIPLGIARDLVENLPLQSGWRYGTGYGGALGEQVRDVMALTSDKPGLKRPPGELISKQLGIPVTAQAMKMARGIARGDPWYKAMMLTEKRSLNPKKTAPKPLTLKSFFGIRSAKKASKAQAAEW